ncbi:efflux RND transporter periplasmic adaptor subunit [Methylomonas sp. MgM2]
MQRRPQVTIGQEFGRQLNGTVKRISRLALLAVCVWWAAACNDTASRQPPMQEVSVKTARPLVKEIIDWDEYTGRIEAVDSVELRARVSGYLEKVNFKAGAKVNKGDLLFVLDAEPFKAQLKYATAEWERAKTKYDLAKNDLARAENLFKAKAISIEEYDGRQKGLREAAAAVVSAEANVYTAKLNLEYTEIRAPISGRVGRELVTAGNLVKDGGEGTVLTTIVSIDPVYVYVDADELSVLRYRRRAQTLGQGSTDLKGTPLQLAVSDEDQFPHSGLLDYVAPAANAATGTVTLRGVFANTGGLLSPGFFARMRVQASDSYQAALLPDRAIGNDQAQQFVWVVKPDNQLEYRKVALGPLLGTMRVVREGVRADDWVVVEGAQKLRPGMSVKPERIALAAEGAQ